MADDRIVLLCSCEDTMPLADGTVRKACRGAEVARFAETHGLKRSLTRDRSFYRDEGGRMSIMARSQRPR